MSETDGAAIVRPAPTHIELERAIASVPGVEEAHVTKVPETGKSRLRIRLANDEDAPGVSWAIAETLRERFGISLDPDAIRPRILAADTVSDNAPEPTASNGDAPEGIAPPSPEPDAANVVVVGDRVLLSEAARAALEAAVTSVGNGTDRLELVEVPDLADDNPEIAPDTDTPGDLAEAARLAIDELDELGEVELDELGEVELGDLDELDELDELAESERAAPRALPADGLRSIPTGDEAVPTADGGAVSDPAADGAALEHSESDSPAPDLDGDSGPITLRRVHTMDGRDDAHHREDQGRATIRHLDTRVDISDVQVTATLSFGGRTVTGHSRSVPTQQGILRAVAEATVAALRALTGDRLVAGIDSVTASVAGEPPMATVLVSILTDRGDETLLGSSLVRQDPERAVMRATLDALNRRVEPWLEIDIAG